jgi:isopenicillin-N epimerase
VLGRRDLLVRTGLTLAAGALATLPPLRVAKGQPAPGDWDAVRDLFSVSRDYLHFGGLLLASHPAPVQQAIETHRRGLDDNPVVYLHEKQSRLEALVLRAAAEYMGARPADIALTDSTTMGLGLLYNGLVLYPGQEILTTTHDFFATHESLQLKAARSGASLRMVPLYRRIDSVSVEEIVDTVRGAIRPETRVLAVTWVHSSTGLKLPVRAIADALAEINAGRGEADRVLLCVDGVHGFGAEDVAVGDPTNGLGCDFFVAGCHKWLFGPRGTGVVWGRGNAAWANVQPTIPSFSGGNAPGVVMTPGGFHSFEHRWALAQAFELHMQIGRYQISTRIHEMNRQLKEGLNGMGRVRLVTPMADELSAGLVCFEVSGLGPQTVVNRLLERRVVATVTPYATAYARLAPGLLNSPEQVDQVLREVRALA